MKTFLSFPRDVIRAAAAAELKRRGVRDGTADAQNDQMVAALRTGLASMRGYIGINYTEAVQQLGERIEADQLTTAEIAFLDGLPPTPISGREYALAMWEISEEF